MQGNITVNFICYLKIKEGRPGEKKGEEERGKAKDPIYPQKIILHLESSYLVLLNAMNMACPSPSAGT